MNRDHVTSFTALPESRHRELPLLAQGSGTWAIPAPDTQLLVAKSPPVLDRSSMILMALWLFIGTVAAYDVYLSVKYQDTLRFEEVNPLGQWLLYIDNGSVAVFMGCKFLGTLIALGTVIVLYCYKRQMGLTVASVLAGVQAMVASYLLFA